MIKILSLIIAIGLTFCIAAEYNKGMKTNTSWITYENEISEINIPEGSVAFIG